MKGILTKTEQGWVVKYLSEYKQSHSSVNEWRYIPLHTNDHRDYVLDNNGYFYFYDGKEVEFEIVKEYTDNHTNQVQSYAKLINHSVGTNKMVCMFEPTTDTSSATICKHCGQEKFMHNQVYPTYTGEYPSFKKFTLMDETPSSLTSDRTIMINPVHNVRKLVEQSWEGCDGCTEQDKMMYKNGYMKGYNTAKETLYTEEQVISIVEKSRATGLTAEYLMLTLKQPKQ